MRAARRAASILDVFATGIAAVPEPLVLVVWAQYATGVALAQRLMGFSLVSLAHIAAAPRALASPAAYDVVVLGPSLTPGERAGVLDACARQETAPAVFELSDEPETADAHLRVLFVPAAHAPGLSTVLTALTPSASCS